MLQHLPSSISLRPVALLLSMAFPLLANASNATVNGESGAFFYNYSTNDGIGYNSRSSTTASDGLGHFGGSAQANYGHFWSSSPSYAASWLEYTDSITNSTGTSQAASFGISISKLSLSLQTGWMDNKTAASFSAKVFVNGSTTPQWESSASLEETFTNYSQGLGTYHGGQLLPTLTTGGTAPLSFVNSFAGFVNYDHGYGYTYSLATPYSNTINLGNIAAGDTLSVRYLVKIVALTNAYGGSASVIFEDPSNLSLGGASEVLPTAQLEFAQAVPEPDTYAMMAAGLGLLAAASRRRKRNAN